MKFPAYQIATTDAVENLVPHGLRWTLVGLFLTFGVVNPDWKHVIQAIATVAQFRPFDMRVFFQGRDGISSTIGTLELLAAASLSFGWRTTPLRALAVAQTVSLTAFVVVLTLLSVRFQLGFEVYGPSVTPQETGGGFFIKDLVLMALTSSVLAITDL